MSYSIFSSETSVEFQRTTRHHIPEDRIVPITHLIIFLFSYLSTNMTETNTCTCWFCYFKQYCNVAYFIIVVRYLWLSCVGLSPADLPAESIQSDNRKFRSCVISPRFYIRRVVQLLRCKHKRKLGKGSERWLDSNNDDDISPTSVKVWAFASFCL
jgi:hypothetical protein